MLKFDDVIYDYEEEAFHFNVAINQGDIVAVLGGSGAGKSTLLNLVAGFIEPKNGDIIIAGNSMLNTEPYLRPLSMLFQERNLFDHLSVHDNIGLGLNPGLKLNKEQQQKIVEVCEQVGIKKLLSRLPGELSGGQKQRVALARCFVQNNPLLLLDEPFSALDPVLREEMLNIVKSLAKQQNMTVMMVTHHLSDALNAATHYLFVDHGEIISSGEMAQLQRAGIPDAVSKFIHAG
ncbi:thiamine ABC transporter ATP-binding protein [Psychromonas sp. PT13]|uniref:thiamine ABC transporter ATP-binding protein n=1 Tax=Psychromonas sp. PT13 TaxID=3439547 RepID=UPI003EBB5C8D